MKPEVVHRLIADFLARTPSGMATTFKIAQALGIQKRTARIHLNLMVKWGFLDVERLGQTDVWKLKEGKPRK